MLEQRWLSLDALCSTLRISKTYSRWLIKNNYIVFIGYGEQRRYLDPTPEYAERLRLAGVLLQQTVFIPPDITEVALLSLREVALICGWTLGYARQYMAKHTEVPRLKVSPQLHLYTTAAIRDILWRRQGRKMSKQRSPFLVTELIALFRKEYEESNRVTPTDARFMEDELVQKKLESIVRRSDRLVAEKDFASKVELARKIVQILDSVKPRLDDAPTEPNTRLPEAPGLPQ